MSLARIFAGKSNVLLGGWLRQSKTAIRLKSRRGNRGSRSRVFNLMVQCSAGLELLMALKVHHPAQPIRGLL